LCKNLWVIFPKPANFLLQYDKAKIELTQMEAALLQYFLVHKNEVLKRKQIFTGIWGRMIIFW
jgi:DNA-binding winged helix-turn-helix (wHTH) protein